MKPASLNIEAYCIFLRHYISLLANNYKSVRILFDLRQQKLYQLISQPSKLHRELQSTIVEIILAYQPSAVRQQAIRSTIVEIILAYQPVSNSRVNNANLRQQKLYQLISQSLGCLQDLQIYDSRNYISLLALETSLTRAWSIYDSRNYISLLAISVHSV